MTADDRLRDLVTRFTHEPEWLPSIAREIADAVSAELADADDREAVRDTLLPSVESMLRVLVYMVRDRIPPEQAELPPASIARARAAVRAGYPLDPLLQGLQIGHGVFFRRWAAAAQATFGETREFATAVELGAAWTFAFVQALSAQIVRRYGVEREQWVRSTTALRDQCVEAVLSGEQGDLSAAARTLRYEFDRRHTAIAVWGDADAGDDGYARLERAALALADQLGGGPPLVVTRPGGVVVAWIGAHGAPAPASAAPQPRLALDVRELPGVRAAVGATAGGVEGFRSSYREALHAMRASRLTGVRQGAVISYDDVALTALVTVDVEQARDFVVNELGPLATTDDHAVRLRATLGVYLEENLSPRRTAQRLGVHENTVVRRIRAVREQLPRPLEQRGAELQVALRLARLAHSD